MIGKITIQFAKISDSEMVSDLATKTFFDTYKDKLNLNGIKTYTKNNFNPKLISKEIKNNDAWYLLIYENKKPIGYLKLEWTKTPMRFKALKALEINKLYLIKYRQNIGIGTMIMGRIKKLAKKHGYSVIWLKVWEHNKIALNFYRKLGFKEIETVDFKFVGQILIDHLLAINI